MEPKLGVIFVVVLAIVGDRAVGASPADFKPCDDVVVSQCTVESVDISPCKKPDRCVLKKGTNTSIVFDYTPNFSASKMLNQVYWAKEIADVPLAGMETDACMFTACPLEAGKKQQYSYQLYLGKKLPKGTYDIKWKLWNEEQDTQLCCFVAKIAL